MTKKKQVKKTSLPYTVSKNNKKKLKKIGMTCEIVDICIKL